MDKMINRIGIAILAAKYVAVVFFAILAFTGSASAADMILVNFQDD